MSEKGVWLLKIGVKLFPKPVHEWLYLIKSFLIEPAFPARELNETDFDLRWEKRQPFTID